MLVSKAPAVFPQIRIAGIIISNNLQMQILLENTIFLLHRNVRIACIIRVAGIIRGMALYEKIHYISLKSKDTVLTKT